MFSVRLKKGKEKAVRQFHPWIFSGAVERVIGYPENGAIVSVTDSAGSFLAYGFFNGQSRVAVRLIEWNQDVIIDEFWWRKKIQSALRNREHLSSEGTNTYRLIFSEADFIPGLIVDRYADFLSVQILTSGVEKAKPTIISQLMELLHPKGIFDRSDAGARAHEGMEASSGGVLAGVEPPEFVEVKENGISYLVNIVEGQKSGFYCDQRDNRRIVAEYAQGRKFLDCFSYSGGFSLNALKHGASEVTSVDSSGLAIETLKRNVGINQFEAGISHRTIQSDVNKQLRAFRDQNEKFDIIVLDPPKYAPSRSALSKAARAYKDLNRQAMLLLNQGGLLATFSCSGAVDLATFKQIIAWSALDAGKEVQFIGQFSQPADHPVRSSFPEGEYLKGLLCRVI